MSYLCVLEIKLLLVTSFVNIFSHSVGRLSFFFFVVSFAVQKLVSLIRSICLFLLLFLLPWETDLRKHWYDLCQRMFCLHSLLEVFTVSCLTFKSLSYFEFIFVCGVRVCSNFIDLLMALQLSQHHLEKDFFFHLYILTSFVEV